MRWHFMRCYRSDARTPVSHLTLFVPVSFLLLLYIITSTESAAIASAEEKIDLFLRFLASYFSTSDYLCIHFTLKERSAAAVVVEPQEKSFHIFRQKHGPPERFV